VRKVLMGQSMYDAEAAYVMVIGTIQEILEDWVPEEQDQRRDDRWAA
jgi:hypothetical protein